MDIISIIKDYFKSENLQEFINHRFWDTDRLVIPQLKDVNGNYDFSKWMKIVSHDGENFFYWDDMVTTIESIKREYLYHDIRKDDIVLDIGGCIGAYSLYVSHMVNKVFVVEPLLDERIKKNIELTNSINNSIHNVEIIKGALSLDDDEVVEISFHNKTLKVPSYSLTQLKEMCGGHIDVLKCDCEGGEWNIKSEELDEIRRVEFEIHIGDSFEYHGGTSRKVNVNKIYYTDDDKTFDEYIDMLKDCGFFCTQTILDSHTCLVHGTRIKV